MRTLATYWPTRTLSSNLLGEMDRLFTQPVYDERSFSPVCEISEAEEHYLLSVDLPGMKKSDIKIELVDKLLTISGERKREVSEKKETVQRYEKSYGFFKRSFTIPSSVDAEKVEARYEDGVLELFIPKAASAKPRQIEIQTA
ncbi:Hsp20/alpha crystallin family protein [Bdellovibrio reynosensis]|uniref:Hsp20/alpha crystallin family protein n=1 Tax=Bdellovibrio reynosensis TaxID=2835041 RepID=A0ABY4C5V4_9BACT|nr:Hsp20/alpha crystallin family protein [Bdellovibrio reynosensis]UOF00114.1 Hsp20/alpha crystallin family protein [Bdellovibrio reynosensis]